VVDTSLYVHESSIGKFPFPTTGLVSKTLRLHVMRQNIALYSCAPRPSAFADEIIINRQRIPLLQPRRLRSYLLCPLLSIDTAGSQQTCHKLRHRIYNFSDLPFNHWHLDHCAICQTYRAVGRMRSNPKADGTQRIGWKLPLWTIPYSAHVAHYCPSCPNGVRFLSFSVRTIRYIPVCPLDPHMDRPFLL
jgi:hypothetical protein